jgi:hypothetical protein
MPRDHRLQNPNDYVEGANDYFGRNSVSKINYGEAFAAKPFEGEAPFNINRFGTKELQNKIVSKKINLNPRLNFVGDDPVNFELFSGVGRFDTQRGELYDFDLGKPNTKMNFTNSPDFKQFWVEAYNLSPTIAPGDRATNPMPRISNPDPKGYLMAAAEDKVEREVSDDRSVAQLIEEGGGVETEKEEEKDVEEGVTSSDTKKD